MRKKILVYMETDTDWNDDFIERDIKQELNCCSCFYEDVIIKIFDIGEVDENKVSK